MQAPPVLTQRDAFREHLRLLRPKQWVKSFFVLPAPLFGLAHAQATAPKLASLAAAFAAFCLLSSFVYAVNDVLDAEADRRHPTKKLRPVASGSVGVGSALSLAGGLLVLGSCLSAAAGAGFAGIMLGYLANNAAYIFLLKDRVIADVLSISVGFMLRILGGAVAVGVEPSSWLMICGFSVALFLAFCKRRSEVEIYRDAQAAADVRTVFRSYTAEKLNLLAGATAAIAIVTYMLFTVSPETVERHGTKALIYTSPFVVYCVFRYLMKAMELRGEDAAETVLKDTGFLAAAAGWLAAVAWILYGT
ncbi:MAG: UbiA prenyltransferase family protein [Planctomycetes bacterium]|nr:UbiA prenyltransferase family protein [Planctomycetota bacterium]